MTDTLQLRQVDPVDALATKVSDRCGLAIDPLQIAAMLESDGMTDRMALQDYGYKDVFALAEDIYRRIPHRGPGEPHPRPDRIQALRELSHGLLYTLPSAVFPAVAFLLGAKDTITGMVYATAFGWVWTMGWTSVAYRMLGHGRKDLAAMVLRRSLVLGVLVPTAIGALFLPPPTLALTVAQLAFQLAGGILLFHRREPVLFALSAPAVGVGLGFLFGDGTRALAVAAVAAAGACVLLVCAFAVLEVVRIAPVKEPAVPIRSEIPRALPVIAYAALSALYLLSADARFDQPRLDLALAVTPIVLGMGVLEWRARRFGERSLGLLRRTRYPAEFRARVLRAFAVDITVAVGTLACLAGVLAAFLYANGQLSRLGVASLAGHVLLGGAYFTGFLLINQARFGRLLGVLGCVVAGYLGAVAYLGPDRQVLVFGICSALLVFGLVIGLLPDLGQVWRYASY
ncbi:hypothetical protein AB0M43_18225 [Longispora sp. NPDC051575]|uniref:hypothetical protein n=1 Tax=Longispora sp. NPDC051575 TaxID=3154943 RepID=UPI003446A48B